MGCNNKGEKVQGYIRNGIYTYHGIPYAETKPFMPPEKVPAWEGVRLALNYGPMSLLNSCQNLNIESLSRKGDIVVVSINHRLNVLGFLDLSA